MTKRYYNAAFKKGGTCLSGQRFRQQVLGENPPKTWKKCRPILPPAFSSRKTKFYQSTAQYLDLTSGNRVIQSHTVSLSLYFSVT